MSSAATAYYLLFITFIIIIILIVFILSDYYADQGWVQQQQLQVDGHGSGCHTRRASAGPAAHDSAAGGGPCDPHGAAVPHGFD